MRFFSAISDEEVSAGAVGRVIDELQSAGAERLDAAFVFFTAHHVEAAVAILARLRRELDPQVIVGCSAEGVIGVNREIERGPGLTVLAAQLPDDVRVHPFHISGEGDWREMLTDADALVERIAYGPQTRALIGFGDPFTSPMGQFLPALDRAAPGAPLAGGMASSARAPGENVLLWNDDVFDEGFVGVSMSGPAAVETIVSQGCRPIGRPAVITRSHENVIDQLGGKPALEVLRKLVNELDEEDKGHLANGLFLGRAISEYRDTFGRGDFLVRNVIGVEESSGSIGVAEYVKTGQTVQFHVRDAATASEDLDALLAGQSDGARPPAAGALLFSCNGRGCRLFADAGHDAQAAHRAMPATPIAGFFAAGELGPVGGRNFIHGHTASFALFRPEG